MKKIIKIDDEYKAAVPEKIIAIGSSSEDFKLAISINKTLNIFLSIHKIDYINDKKPILYLSPEQNNTNFYLFSNKTDKGILSKKFKNIDYFLAIIAPESEEFLSRISSKLKENKLINARFIVPPDKELKSFMKLLI